MTTIKKSRAASKRKAKIVRIHISKSHHKHTVFIRFFHWSNALLLALMIWSGAMIYWANDVYTPEFFGAFLAKIGIGYRLAEGLGLHFFIMWLFTLNGLIYVFYLLCTGQWRERAPQSGTLKHAWLKVLHDLHLKKNAPPVRKFNGAQVIAYCGVVTMGMLSVLTGIAIYKPVRAGALTAAFGGYESARLIHFILTVLYLLFFVVHLSQVIRAGWKNFRSMITGFEESA